MRADGIRRKPGLSWVLPAVSVIVARKCGAHFLDASAIVSSNPSDETRLDPAEAQTLALAINAILAPLLSRNPPTASAQATRHTRRIPLDDLLAVTISAVRIAEARADARSAPFGKDGLDDKPVFGRESFGDQGPRFSFVARDNVAHLHLGPVVVKKRVPSSRGDEAPDLLVEQLNHIDLVAVIRQVKHFLQTPPHNLLIFFRSLRSAGVLALPDGQSKADSPN